jgi:hypothetical protein
MFGTDLGLLRNVTEEIAPCKPSTSSDKLLDMRATDMVGSRKSTATKRLAKIAMALEGPRAADFLGR